MSSNIRPVAQAQAQAQAVTVAASVPVPVFPPRIPPIPPSTTSAYTGPSCELPQLSPSLDRAQVQPALSDIVAEYGFSDAAIVAAQYHNARSPGGAQPYTEWELILRDLDACSKLGANFHAFLQRTPNAIALRFLAPRAGQGFPFDERDTWGTNNSTGKRVFGRKCGCNGCEYRNRDRNRHTEEKHVQDPGFALCCPYHGCCCVFFAGSFRSSQMENHIKWHEQRNKGETKGRRGIMPLSTFRRP